MYWTQSKTNILVVGHRGYKARYPENTMLSFEKAIELGVDGIEVDLNLTEDGIPVMIHDATVDRTTNGTGAVLSFDLCRLQKLDAGGGEHIPTFEEFLDRMKSTDLLLNVEIKDMRTVLVDKAVRMLHAAGFRDRYVITSWDADMTTYAHREYGVKTQGFMKEGLSNYQEDTYSHYYSVGISMDCLTRERCEEFCALGIDPWCWCPDTDEAIEDLIQCGSTLATCNNPEPALRILRERGLHR